MKQLKPLKRPLLVPQPRSIELGKATFELSAVQQKQIYDFTLDKPLPDGFAYTLVEPLPGKHDWYQLKIHSDGVEIEAAARSGLFYALQTIKQILRQSSSGGVPTGQFEDWADYKVRGVLYDISRDRVPTLETLKELINMWAEWKYNQLQLYTEHTFAYSGHKSVWKNASPLTADEMRELGEYCRLRGIELVPNQNSFGHMERWLQHEEYTHLAESPGGFYDPWGEFRFSSSTLSPAVDAAIPFLSELYDELLPCFESGYLNIGGDEPWELGKGRSKALCETEGLDRLYFNFLMKIYSLARSKGKSVQVYGDIVMKYPHLIEELPKDMVLINWGYEADHPFEHECEQIAASNLSFYVCTGNSAWNSLGGRWENTRLNIAHGAAQGMKYGAEGLLVSEWGDNGHWQQLFAGLPGFLFGACAAWNLEALTLSDPEAVLAVHVFEGSRELAAAAMQLQHVWEQSGVRLHNVSLPAVLLLDPVFPYYRSEYHQFQNYSFENENELLDSAKANLDRAMSAPDLSSKTARYTAELQFTQKLLQHGCRLGRLQMATDQLTVAEIASEERKALAAELEPLIEEYRRLWLQRSRPGGLADSTARMESLLHSYREDRR
ncbi:MAG: family 20 glycosylhydrolase [Spirochaetia bacterium]